MLIQKQLSKEKSLNNAIVANEYMFTLTILEKIKEARLIKLSQGSIKVL